MTKFWKAALTATILTASAAVLCGCVDAYGYNNGYAAGYGYGPYDYGYGYGYLPQGGIGFSYDSGGYCDAFGCPNDYWDLPIYYGPVYFGGSWYDGPVYYRDRHGRRQYWIHGGWHDDEWRGPRPRWWHEGRYGPALGRQFYRSHGFGGRPENNRRFDNRRNDNIRRFDNRQVAPQRFDNRPNNNVRRFDNRRATPPQVENRGPGDRGLVNRGPDRGRAGNRNSDNRAVERGRDRRDPGIVNRREFRGGAARQPRVHAAPPRQAPRHENNNRGRRSDERNRNR